MNNKPYTNISRDYDHNSLESVSMTETNPFSTATPSTVVVETGKLNLRKEPNFKSTIICVLDKGTELTVISDVKGFYEVKTKSGITGYTSKNFVK